MGAIAGARLSPSEMVTVFEELQQHVDDILVARLEKLSDDELAEQITAMLREREMRRQAHLRVVSFESRGTKPPAADDGGGYGYGRLDAA